MVTENERPLDDFKMEDAPETASFTYKGRLVTEEWTYLPLEKRTRGDFIKADVPYYHVAFQPLSYRISDGGMEGDGLEHTYVAIKSAQGELTPKNSGRDELVKAFTKLGFDRNVVADLTNKSAIGKVFMVKRYNRSYTRAGQEPIRGELMNVPIERLADDWAPAPGVTIPEFSRKPRSSSGGAGSNMASGSVTKPIGVTLAQVADAVAAAEVNATEAAVRAFILDRNDLAQGDALDFALTQTLLSKLVEEGLVTTDTGRVARA